MDHSGQWPKEITNVRHLPGSLSECPLSLAGWKVAPRTLLIPWVDPALLHQASLHLVLQGPPFPKPSLSIYSRLYARGTLQEGQGAQGHEAGHSCSVSCSFQVLPWAAGALCHRSSLPTGSPSFSSFPLNPLEREGKHLCMPPIGEESQQKGSEARSPGAMPDPDHSSKLPAYLTL